MVIPRTLAEKKYVEVYDKNEPVVLNPWDPMVGRSESHCGAIRLQHIRVHLLERILLWVVFFCRLEAQVLFGLGPGNSKCDVHVLPMFPCTSLCLFCCQARVSPDKTVHAFNQLFIPDLAFGCHYSSLGRAVAAVICASVLRP